MDIKGYISSGIIESYVLGLASAEEREEFEALCSEHPELEAARIEFEEALEKQLQDNAMIPPAGVKDKLMSSFRQDGHVPKSKIITLQGSDTPRSTGMLRYVAAASIILLLTAAYFAYTFYEKNKELNESMEQVKAENQKMKEFQEMSTRPNLAVVNLTPTTPVPASANVYWDSTSSDVYLVVKNLPRLPNSKQYQLWSIINGQDGNLQPNSMGLFDVGDDKKIILKMPNVTKADAFAITIEDRGNTGGPTLDSLKTMGKTRL